MTMSKREAKRPKRPIKRPERHKTLAWAKAPRAPEPAAAPDPLAPDDRAFVLAYIASGGNGTRAYLQVHPDVTVASAATLAWRLLRKIEIQQALNVSRDELFRRLKMSGEEALALLSLSARADIGEAYDDEGRLLPVHQWPDALRLAVKAIKFKQFGPEIYLQDGLKARELVAIATGRLRPQLDHKHTFDHAKYLADEEAG